MFRLLTNSLILVRWSCSSNVTAPPKSDSFLLLLLLQHWPSPSKRWQFVTSHMVRGCPPSLSHRANDRPTRYRFFSLFDPGAYPTFTKRGDDPPRSIILQNFSPIAQTVYEICVTKVFHFLA